MTGVVCNQVTDFGWRGAPGNSPAQFETGTEDFFSRALHLSVTAYACTSKTGQNG
jgi:hypothetical protein